MAIGPINTAAMIRYGWHMRSTSLIVTIMMLLGACTTVPSGPSVLVLPGTNKTFDQFRNEDVGCRQFAQGQLDGHTPNSAGVHSGVTTAAVATLIGAAAGAAINGSSGAGVGAGAGLATGGLIGTGTAEYSQYALQRRYDNAYQQCMYAYGHRVPIASRFVEAPPAPQGSMPPPYPPGRPPQ